VFASSVHLCLVLFCALSLSLSLSLSTRSSSIGGLPRSVFWRRRETTQLLQKGFVDPLVKILLLLLLLLLLLFLLRFFAFRVEGSASEGFGIERDLCAYKTNVCSSSIRLTFVAGIVISWIFVYIRFELSLRFCSLFLLCVRACV